jgi:hypothetical protein
VAVISAFLSVLVQREGLAALPGGNIPYYEISISLCKIVNWVTPGVVKAEPAVTPASAVAIVTSALGVCDGLLSKVEFRMTE